MLNLNDLIQTWKKASRAVENVGCIACTLQLADRVGPIMPPALNHAISRQQTLRQIAANGKVYGPEQPSIQEAKKGLTGYIYKLQGIASHASTFRGLCNFHDHIIFSRLDKGTFAIEAGDLSLSALRSLVHEFYLHSKRRKELEFLSHPDNTPNLEVRKYYRQELEESYGTCHERRLEMVAAGIHMAFSPDHTGTGALASSMRHLVFPVDHAFPFRSCGAGRARYSVSGRFFDDEVTSGIPNAIGAVRPIIGAISTISNDDLTYVVISYLRDIIEEAVSQEPNWGDALLQTAQDIDCDEIKITLAKYLVYTSGTTFIDPRWFNRVSPIRQRRLARLADMGRTAERMPGNADYNFLYRAPGEVHQPIIV